MNHNKRQLLPQFLFLLVLLCMLCVVTVFAVAVFERDKKNEKFMEQIYSRLSKPNYELDVIGKGFGADISTPALTYTRLPHKAVKINKPPTYRLVRPRD